MKKLVKNYKVVVRPKNYKIGPNEIIRVENTVDPNEEKVK
jgi:hypothetical protein